jgi:hypothetical protein
VEDRRGSYLIFVGKPEGNGRLGETSSRREDNIKMDLREMIWEILNWIGLAWDRDSWRAVGNMAVKLRFPLHEGNFLSSGGNFIFE